MNQNKDLKLNGRYDLMTKKGVKMREKNILCCINDFPLFTYQPLSQKKEKNREQNILNFVIDPPSKKWIKKEIIDEKQIKLIYYEINMRTAILKLKKPTQSKKTEIESFCLSLLEYIIKENQEKLLTFLKNTNSLKEEELETFKISFI